MRLPLGGWAGKLVINDTIIVKKTTRLWLSIKNTSAVNISFHG